MRWKGHPVAVLAVLILTIGALLCREAIRETATPPSAPSGSKGRELVSQEVSLKEGQTMMVSFTLSSDASVEVKVRAEPRGWRAARTLPNVDVMLMTVDEVERYKKSNATSFDGYGRTLSKRDIRSMNETRVLPAGSWTIAVQRPHEAFVEKETTVLVEVTAY